MCTNDTYVNLIYHTYLEAARQKSERVLVFSELGISRAPVACMAYLMKKNKWTLQVYHYMLHMFALLKYFAI